MKTICFANQKGGIGKTTSAVTVAHGLTLAHKKVLLIDFDSQGHAAIKLGLDPVNNIFKWLIAEGGQSVITQTGRNNLFLVPGNKKTATVQGMIVMERRPISFVRDELKDLTRGLSFDYVIFDTPPGVGGLQELAIFASDYLIIPTGCNFLSVEAIGQTLDTSKNLRESMKWDGRLIGILPTFLDDRVKESATVYDEVKARFGDLTLAPIHTSAALAECPAEGITIFEKVTQKSMKSDKYAARASNEYGALVRKILEMK